MALLTHTIRQFPYGQIDTIEDKKIPDGAASAALDWIPLGDRIELRRGYLLIGEVDDGAGRVTGLHVMVKADGTQVLVKTYARKLKYFDETLATPAWVENGSDILPAAASGEDVLFDNYSSLAGAQTFFSSPSSGLYKLMCANPGSLTDLTNAAKNFAGYMRIYFNRIILWGRLKDLTGIYGSYIDAAAYTTVSAEILGASGSQTYTGTLAFKGGGATRTCFGLLPSGTTGAGVETFRDDYNGNLIGSLGGTGTINYTTGAYSITFNGAVTSGNVTCDYQWEDSNNTGLGDFTKSSPRTAGQGFVFRQDDAGGAARGVGVYNDVLYCLHVLRTWQLSITSNDTGATNLPYRDKVGIPNFRAYVPTGRGVYYVDDANSNDTQLRLLTLNQIGTLVVPTSVSKRTVKGIILGVDLSAYRFDQAAMIEWGDYIVVACRRQNSEANDRVLLYNQKSGAISWHDYFVSCFAIYNGRLLAGDSISNNVYELFSGFDDDDSLISANYWETELSELQIEELKKCKKFAPQGLIATTQSFDVYMNLDNGGFVKVGSISGTESYVDRNNEVLVGSNGVGENIVGGGSGGVSAYNFEHPIRLALDKFSEIKVRFVATGIGYLSINQYKWFDIRPKGKKFVKKYR